MITLKDAEKGFFVYETPHASGGNKRHLHLHECHSADHYFIQDSLICMCGHYMQSYQLCTLSQHTVVYTDHAAYLL